MPGRKFVSVLFHETDPPAEHEFLRTSAPARLNRRTLIQAAVGAALAFGAARDAVAADAQRATKSSDTALAALLQRLAEEHLRRSPEEATGLGLDTGKNASLRSRLDDRSLEAIATHRKAVDAALTQLTRIDRSSLGTAARLDYDVANFVYTTLADQLGRYGFVDINLRPSPYVVSQMNGAYYWLPDFIGSRHPLESQQDLEAYFARLSALAVALDQETERIRHDAGLGVILPVFTLATTIAQVHALRETPAAQTAAIAPAIKRAAAAGLGDITQRADQIYRKLVVPALSRQIDALRTLQDKADNDAGVWALPDGESYYASALLSNTTSRSSAAELHERGMQLVAELTSELDKALREQGYTDGAVVTRIDALNRDRRYLVSDDDAGRERLLAAAGTAVEKIRARLPAGFKTVPNDPLEVRRIPQAIESGAPGAFYSDGVGGAPATFSLNLKSPAEMPLWRLPTLAHHEGIPGHHFQYSVLQAAGELPLFRRLVRFSAYTEGWALYAERVADELGCLPGRCGRPHRAAAIRAVPRGAHRGRYRNSSSPLAARAGDPLDDRERRRATGGGPARDRSLLRISGASVQLHGRGDADSRRARASSSAPGNALRRARFPRPRAAFRSRTAGRAERDGRVNVGPQIAVNAT